MTRKGPPVHEGPFLSPPRTPTSGRASALVTKVWLRLALPRLIQHPATRLVLLVVLMTFHLALIIATAYLIDLTISLAELWIDLARKHLEITLQIGVGEIP